MHDGEFRDRGRRHGPIVLAPVLLVDGYDTGGAEGSRVFLVGQIALRRSDGEIAEIRRRRSTRSVERGPRTALQPGTDVIDARIKRDVVYG